MKWLITLLLSFGLLISGIMFWQLTETVDGLISRAEADEQEIVRIRERAEKAERLAADLEEKLEAIRYSHVR